MPPQAHRTVMPCIDIGGDDSLITLTVHRLTLKEGQPLPDQGLALFFSLFSSRLPDGSTTIVVFPPYSLPACIVLLFWFLHSLQLIVTVSNVFALLTPALSLAWCFGSSHCLDNRTVSSSEFEQVLSAPLPDFDESCALLAY
jgi:hypothetical protein